MLAVIETHPVQYHAPVYRALQQKFGVPVTAIYGSDFSVRGYRDAEFNASFAWDTDLLEGYESRFLARADQGANAPDRVSTDGLGAVLADVKPDAILLLGYSPSFYRSAWLQAWRTGRPILFRGETNDDAQVRSFLKSAVRRSVLRLAYQRCARLLYIGERSRAHYRDLGFNGNRLVFSPYCVDLSAFQADERAREKLRAATRASLNLTDDRVVIIFSGKLSPRKGVDLIVPAVRQLPAPLQARAVVAFLGDGDLRPSLEVAAAVAPRVDVRFLGFQNQHSLSRFYHAADLLVLPSRTSETWGLVVNEALHHGLPCAVSDRVGCMPDLVEGGATGSVFNADSAAGMARAIQIVTALAGRPETRDACRRKVAGFTVDRAAEGVAEAYEAVVRPGAGRGAA